ncbi:MAG: VanZ family protein [Planctomycetes bacterium]|nr:VanZ family protein [Planctomycetota bacterium]
MRNGRGTRVEGQGPAETASGPDGNGPANSGSGVGAGKCSARWPLLALVIYWGGLFVATHVPAPSLGRMPQGSDKAMHLAAFAGLGFLSMWWRHARGGVLRREVWLVLAVCALYAAIDELLQIPIASRRGDILDWLADIAGAALGVAAYGAVSRAFGRTSTV